MNILLENGTELSALGVLGGKGYDQGSRREYLEFLFPQAGNTVEALEQALAGEHCGSITLEDPETGEQFVYTGYVLRGGVRVFRDEESGTWTIGLKRCQQTELEKTVAQLQQAVAQMQEAQR